MTRLDEPIILSVVGQNELGHITKKVVILKDFLQNLVFIHKIFQFLKKIFPKISAFRNFTTICSIFIAINHQAFDSMNLLTAQLSERAA